MSIINNVSFRQTIDPSPDVAVIEDEFNLEDLMKQKELLQARLGAYGSESDEDGNDVGEICDQVVTSSKKTVISSKDDFKKTEISDVILLDDSSGDEVAATATSKKRSKTMAVPIAKKRRSRSLSPIDLERKETSNRNEGRLEHETQKFKRNSDNLERSKGDGRSDRNRTMDSGNRNKEDLRNEIERSYRDRDRERERDRERDRDRDRDRIRDRDRRRIDERDRYNRRRSPERRRSWGREIDPRKPRYGDRDYRSRSNEKMGRNRSPRDDGRRRMNDKRKKDDRKDKYRGSLSEGQKVYEASSSSESTIADIDIDDEEDEEKIIEQRRKQREELMKVNDFKSFEYISIKEIFLLEICNE